MAKKKVMEINISSTKIYSPFFKGYLDEMPQEAKDKMKAEKPDVYKSIFGEDVVIEEPTPEVVE